VRGTRPTLVVWPAIGIGLITLPGQAFFVSESVIVAQFVWPLVLALITGYRWNRWAFTVMLALLFLLHPMTSLVLATAAVVALVVGRRRPDDRSWAWRQAAVLFAVAVVRQAITSAGIDSEVPRQADIVAQWGHAVNGTPLTVVIITVIGSGALLVGWLLRDHRIGSRTAYSATIAWVGVALLVVAGALMLRWASNTRLWWQALDYRSFVLVFALPAVLWAMVDGLVPRPAPGAPGSGAAHGARRSAHPSALLVVGLMGVVFSAVLGAQSLGWHRLMAKVDSAVRAAPQACVLESSIPEHHSALDHWATPALALLGQGRSPHRVVVHEPAACVQLSVKGTLSVPRTAKLRKPVSHWFDFDRVRAAIAAQPLPNVP